MRGVSRATRRSGTATPRPLVGNVFVGQFAAVRRSKAVPRDRLSRATHADPQLRTGQVENRLATRRRRYRLRVSADVSIRRCVAQDAPALAAMYAADRDQVLPAEPAPAPPFFTVAGQLERITRTWPDHNCLGFVAVIRDQVVGLLLLEDVADRSAIVGYYVASASRGRGVATAAVGALVQAAQQDVGLLRLVADIDPGNVASRRVAEQDGFRAVGSVNIGVATFDRFVIGSELVLPAPTTSGTRPDVARNDYSTVSRPLPPDGGGRLGSRTPLPPLPRRRPRGAPGFRSSSSSNGLGVAFQRPTARLPDRDRRDLQKRSTTDNPLAGRW
jgi:ribosomal-protein-alanine N-acetyltransferase